MSLSQEEIEKMKQEFRKADHRGDNSITMSDLTQVFQELDGWSLEDLNDLFSAMGAGHGENTVRIKNFVDWIMQDDDDEEGDAPMPGIDEEREEDEDDFQDQTLSLKAAIPDCEMDLNFEITHKEWMMLAMLLEEDLEEAKEGYENCVRKTLAEKGASAEAEAPVDYSMTVSMKAFLDDQGISPADTESLIYVEEKLAAAKKKIAQGDSHEGPGTEKMHVALPVAIEQIVRCLDFSQRPATDLWDIVDKGEVYLSHAGRRAIDGFRDKPDELANMVKAAKTHPHMLAACAGRQANREHCQDRVRTIIAKCKKDGTKFTDPDWDVVNAPEQVLYVDQQAPGYDCTVEKPAGFKRLTEIVENPALFKGAVRAGDIVQGRCGTCFLLGALGAMVSNDVDSVKSCFVEYDTDVGVYGVRLNLDGEWVHVVVDDYVAVDQYGRILYAKGNDREELWIPLLEKAYCKLHTCYEMCDGGQPGEAVAALCGGVKGKFTLTKKKRADPATPDTYFKALKNARSKGWVLTTTFTQTIANFAGGKSGQGKCGEDVLSTGLVRGHVYSVLKLVEHNGSRLICCRNPWGQGEWKGKWSDGNTQGEWTEEMKAAAGYKAGNDGTFWMSIEDFVATSGGVSYSRTFGSQWKKISQYGHFQKVPLEATALWAYKAGADDEISMEKGAKVTVDRIAKGWWHGLVIGQEKGGYFPGNYVRLNDRPVARFDLDSTESVDAKETMTAVVALIQPLAHRKRVYSEHRPDGKNYKDVAYPKVMLVVVGPDGKVLLKKEGKMREVSGEITLYGGSGKWQVYAICQDGPGGTGFTVRAFLKGGTATLEEVSGAKLSDVLPLITK